MLQDMTAEEVPEGYSITYEYNPGQFPPSLTPNSASFGNRYSLTVVPLNSTNFLYLHFVYSLTLVGVTVRLSSGEEMVCEGFGHINRCHSNGTTDKMAPQKKIKINSEQESLPV